MTASTPRDIQRPSGLELNSAQRAAVEHLHGPLLVIAGAGTGKTRVSTERVLHLLRTLPDLDGENILAITYTRKAAAEMATRIRRRGDKRAERVTVSTFHAFCYELLRRYNQEVKLLDKVDAWIFLRRRLDHLGLDLFKKLSEPGRFLNAFAEFFSRCQDELVNPKDYSDYVAGLIAAFEREKTLLAAEERARREEELRRQQEIARAYAAAERLLREANRTTFGGSLLAAVQLLTTNAELRAQLQDRLRYILVDEFQDANVAQITLLHLLGGQRRNLMVVGDDDQAIYRFRGASYASFRKFEELFPDCRKITLTQNYRSTGRLLHVASTLIAQNGPARFDPRKKLTPNQPPGEKVRVAEVEDPAAEAAYVRAEIQRRYQATGSYAGGAVLYRAHAHRNALVEALARAGIPFVIRGLSILSSTLIRDLVAYLRAIDAPYDNVSLARLLAIPVWGFTPEMLLELIHRARRERCSLADAVETLHPRVRDEQTRLGALLGLLTDLRARAAALPLTQLFGELVERLELRLLPSDPDRQHLDAFADFFRQWEQEKSETKRLREFIEYLGYFEEAGGTVCLPEETDARDAVELMTVHAAKGLEFDSVFVLRLNRNDFPTRRRHPLFVFPEALMKEPLPQGDFHIQEERRLAYVALTRARRQLTLTTLTSARKQPSVFLEDILRDPQAARDIDQLAPPAPAALEVPAAADSSLPGRLFRDSPTAAGYSRIIQWAASVNGDAPGAALSLSHSGLETYLKCPLKYKFAHLWQLPGLSTPAMVFGQIMHRSLVEFFRARQHRPGLPLEELQHIYEQQWRGTLWPFRDTYQEQEYQTAGWQQLQGFYRGPGSQPATVLELEKTFQWPWEDVLLTGRIDQINRLDGRQVEIIEYKTGEPRPRDKVEKSLQLALYALAAEHQLGLVPARLTLYNLTVNEPVSFSPTEKAAQRTLETVREVAAKVRAGEFPAKIGFHCRYCDYQRICPEFEQPFPLTGTPAAAKEAAEDTSAEN